MAKTSTPLAPPSDGSPSPRAFRLVIEYDGGRYSGWQRQPRSPSVQQTIEEALAKILRHPVRCDAAGRTDAGVHALGQVARVVTSDGGITANGLRRGANALLPEDVRIVEVEPCALDFNPRRDARRRWYRYSLIERAAPPALDRARLRHAPRPLDWEAVERSLVLLRGEHDFRAFRSSLCRAPRTVLLLERAAHVNEHPVHHLDFECRSFLHHMIRITVGLLMDIGLGKASPDLIGEMLETGRRPPRVRTAPAHGLVLMRVDYDDPREA